MSLKVERGAATVRAQRMLFEEQTRASAAAVGRFFSPVRKVTYNVESARVEQRTDLDS